jgi:hypothetical protein
MKQDSGSMEKVRFIANHIIFHLLFFLDGVFLMRFLPVMMFDTSIMHDAINESDQTRYILMMRLWHPSLTEVERQALQFTYDCLEMPQLVSFNHEERLMAESQLQTIKAFPAINRSKGSGAGFGGGWKAESPKQKKRNGFGS